MWFQKYGCRLYILQHLVINEWSLIERKIMISNESLKLEWTIFLQGSENIYHLPLTPVPRPISFVKSCAWTQQHSLEGCGWSWVRMRQMQTSINNPKVWEFLMVKSSLIFHLCPLFYSNNLYKLRVNVWCLHKRVIDFLPLYFSNVDSAMISRKYHGALHHVRV